MDRSKRKHDDGLRLLRSGIMITLFGYLIMIAGAGQIREAAEASMLDDEGEPCYSAVSAPLLPDVVDHAFRSGWRQGWGQRDDEAARAACPGN